MATYLNYSGQGEDAVVQGAEWLKRIIQSTQGMDAEAEFTEKFKEYVEQHSIERPGYARDWSDLGPVFDLFVDHAEGLFATIPEQRPEDRVKEVESFFALVMSMLMLLEETSHLDAATTRLCEIFSKSAEGPLLAELRLRLLMMLYNTFNNPTFEFRYRVFKYCIDYAAKANLFDQVLPYLEYLDAWMVDWADYLDVDEKRRLYRSISTYMRALGKRLDAFLHLKKYHLLFQGSPAAELAAPAVQEASVELLKDAIQLPSVIQFDDLLALDTIKALSKSKQHSVLVDLCGVFLSGTVNDLRAFNTKHSKLFDEYSLSFQDAMSKIRLLSLATLAHGRPEIELAEVAKALEESEENVERWVVRAISEGVIDGRIDQLNHKVLVKSTFQRKFEKEEWAFLDSKLSQWIENLEHVIKFIADQKEKKEGVL